MENKLPKHQNGIEEQDQKELFKLIETVRVSGDLRCIPPILKMLEVSEKEEIQNSIFHFLFDVKNPNIIPFLLAAITNPSLAKFQRLLVSACWESGINYSSNLSFFVALAGKSDYLVCNECITVIENMDGPFDAKDLEEGIILTKNAADQQEEKFDLLNSLWEILVDFRQE